MNSTGRTGHWMGSGAGCGGLAGFSSAWFEASRKAASATSGLRLGSFSNTSKTSAALSVRPLRNHWAPKTSQASRSSGWTCRCDSRRARLRLNSAGSPYRDWMSGAVTIRPGARRSRPHGAGRRLRWSCREPVRPGPVARAEHECGRSSPILVETVPLLFLGCPARNNRSPKVMSCPARTGSPRLKFAGRTLALRAANIPGMGGGNSGPRRQKRRHHFRKRRQEPSRPDDQNRRVGVKEATATTTADSEAREK